MSLKKEMELTISATNTNMGQKLNNLSFDIKQSIGQLENPYPKEKRIKSLDSDGYPTGHITIWANESYIGFEKACQMLKEILE